MFIVRWMLLSLFILAATMSVPDRWVPGGSVEVTVLSQEKANELFKEFISHKEIPYEYPVDGCYVRATAMALIAEEEKIEMGKAFVEGDIYVDSKSQYGEINWGYHVAPMILVKDAFGKIKKMVFDPSLFSRPVTVEEWVAKMKANPKSKITATYFGGRYQIGPQDVRPNKANSWAKGTKQENKELLAALTETSQAGDPKVFYDYLYKKAWEDAKKKANSKGAQ